MIEARASSDEARAFVAGVSARGFLPRHLQTMARRGVLGPPFLTRPLILSLRKVARR